MRPYVLAPAARVVLDIRVDSVVIVVVPDDMFIVVALPDLGSRRVAESIDAARSGTLERTHKRPKCARCSACWASSACWAGRRRGAQQRALSGRIAMRPYMSFDNRHNAVDVIGHHEERVQRSPAGKTVGAFN